MAGTGVFICWCGENIARTVDVKKVAEEIGKLPGVTVSLEYKYMCSDPGQSLIRQHIRENGLDAVVVASCSPHMHLKTFRAAAAREGLNPYRVEMANIREHCSWVHQDKEEGTAKAIELVAMTVAKVAKDRALDPIRIPVTRRAMVIGGGVAGIQAALDIADGGIEVVLVERAPSIGGRMAGLSETFPTLDCSQCILTPRMVDVGQHPKIRLYTWSEIEEVNGFVGNFEVKVRRKARYVDTTKCTGCGNCWNACPQKKIPGEFDYGTGNRTAIYIPFPQAVPARPVIDAEHCLKLKKGVCGICAKKCAAGAIHYDDQDEIVTEQVGAIVVATGYQLYDFRAPHTDKTKGYGEYGYGRFRDVIDSLQFERIVSASGPTGGEIRRPSDGKEPKCVVFVSCVGSRDNNKGMAYCSKICCMYNAKHTMLYKHKVHDGEAHVFYMDIRSGGKNYDEFVRRAIEQDGALYHRGRVSKITEENGKLIVRGVDTLAGKPVTVEADLVVLAAAMVPSTGAEQLAQKLSVGYDQYGFLSESHPKLRPVETTSAGVFVAGACQAPKDIPESVAQASAAAGKVLGMLSKDELTREPEIARIDERTCAACFACYRTCPYNAIEKTEVRDRKGNFVKMTARVNP
ncbi:MAG: CoB--CoM heterodisulfide reductase iron-sulfur subunit A family protein, partial [Planctomycetia bacterium]|nr:CoB--CoM heterodisulfide reductase iron-sulfur subunit A family protein [Planctomycetia bacterium]